MSNKEFKTRLQLKNDTPEIWEKVSDPSQVENVFIPVLGEPFLYRTEDGDGYQFDLKIGDGIRTPKDLPKFNEQIQSDWNQEDASAVDYIKNKPDVSGQISAHNTNEEAHSDIREQITELEAGAAYIDASDNENVEDSTIDDYVNRQIDTHNNSTDAHGDIREQIGSLSSEIENKANASHTHTKSEITNFPTSMTPTAHNHSASDINSGALGSDRLPTVPVTKGGTGATSASAARTNLGLKTENWTFTLEDGSTVTKAVYVG